MIPDCKICLTEHDEEIHAATLRVHDWLRVQVTRYLNSPTDELAAEGEIVEPHLTAA